MLQIAPGYDLTARIRLTAGCGFNYAFTGRSRHVTVWGLPELLDEAVVGIRPLWDN